MLTQGEVKTMTKGFTLMLAEAVVSFVDPAAASPKRVSASSSGR
jgi:hypothetical protein